MRPPLWRRAHQCLWTACLAGFAALGNPATIDGQDAEVDLNLVIAIDCSFSVATIEYLLQRRGLATAFRDPAVQAAIEFGPEGRIAVTVIQWSSRDSQIVVLPWTVIDGGQSAEALAQTLETMPRLSFDGATSISAAIGIGRRQLANTPYLAARQVIDMQSDGTNNSGPFVDAARDAAVASGIVINGLAIVNEVPYLESYFREHVIGGNGAFVERADDYKDFADAVRRKLLREIGPPSVARLLTE